METQTANTSASKKECVVLSCSGASDLGRISDRVACELNKQGNYSMNCLAKVAARDSSLTELLEQNETLVIDGCQLDCAKKIMEEAWITNYQYINLKDFGYEKGKTPVNDDTINKILKEINHSGQPNIVTHTRPVAYQECNEDSCDMFDFMSKDVGLKILHPGGREATQQLISSLKPSPEMKVLDIACGKGRTSVELAKSFGCQVVGIDLSEESVQEAKKYAVRKKVDHLVSFLVADAQDLPFDNNEFDITMSQAVLILVDDKRKVVEEAARVLKPGGKSAWLELSWKKDPTEEFLIKATDGICAKCISNVITFDGWEKILNIDGINPVAVEKFDMSFRGFMGMLKDEGIVNGLSIMYRYMVYPKIRNRMMKLDNFFKSYPEYIGYGIYLASK